MQQSADVENLHSLVQFISHQQSSLVIGTDVTGVLEHPGLRPLLSETPNKRPVKGKHRHPMIAALRHDDVLVPINRDSKRVKQVAWDLTLPSEPSKQLSVGRKDPHAVVSPVGYHHPPSPVDGDSGRVLQGGFHRPGAEIPLVPPVPVKDVYAGLLPVRDEDLPVEAHGHAPRLSEVGTSDGASTESGNKFACKKGGGGGGVVISIGRHFRDLCVDTRCSISSIRYLRTCISADWYVCTCM